MEAYRPAGGGRVRIGTEGPAEPRALAGGDTRETRLRAAISEAILALRAALRETFLLAQSGEYTYEEIAAMQAAPLGTIKWRVSEARKQIKSWLRQRGYDDV